LTVVAPSIGRGRGHGDRRTHLVCSHRIASRVRSARRYANAKTPRKPGPFPGGKTCPSYTSSFARRTDYLMGSHTPAGARVGYVLSVRCEGCGREHSTLC